MQLLTVPNWSFSGREDLLGIFKEVLCSYHLSIHYLKGDVDHHRTVSAFSGQSDQILKALEEICIQVLPHIDLQLHQGVHPRLGALDVCPFIPVGSYDFEILNLEVKHWASRFAEKFQIPVFLYEQSSTPHLLLPDIRKSMMQGNWKNGFRPDYGPEDPHPKWGVMVTGIRDFLIAMNVNLETINKESAQMIASFIRRARENKEIWATGVRALAFGLQSKNLMQVSMNLTRPDATHPDQIINKIFEVCHQIGVKVHNTELIGVIRKKDIPFSTLLPIDPNQIIDLD